MQAETCCCRTHGPEKNNGSDGMTNLGNRGRKKSVKKIVSIVRGMVCNKVQRQDEMERKEITLRFENFGNYDNSAGLKMPVGQTSYKKND